jgi:hypothetical protein
VSEATGLSQRVLQSLRNLSLPTVLALTAACLFVAWPLFVTPWLPFVDYPQHLGTIAAIHGANDAHFSPYFVTEYARTQYLVLYVMGDVLAYFFGAEGAGRATAILSVAPLPLAVAWFLREHGRPAILGAVSAAVAIHYYVIWGFLNYAAGMITALLALAAFARMNREPDAKHVAFAGLLGLVCFYTHAQLYAFFALATILQLAAMAPALGKKHATRAFLANVLAALPSILGAIIWLRLSGVIEHGEAGARSGHAAEVADAPPGWSAIHDTLRSWADHSLGMYNDGSGEHIAVGFALVLLVLIALRGARSSSEKAATSFEVSAPAASGWKRFFSNAPKRAPFRSYAPELALGLAFAGYLFAPYSYRMIEPINHRFLPLALALLPALGPTASLPKRSLWLVSVLSIALAVFTGVTHRNRFAEASEEMGDLDDALAHTEPGHRLLGLIFDSGSATIRAPIFLHAHQYYQARQGGLACFSFVEFPKSPVQYRPGAEPPPFPPRFEWEPHRYDHHTWGDAFDYWLIRHPAHSAPPNVFHVPAPSGAAMPELVVQTDRWSLFAVPAH